MAQPSAPKKPQTAYRIFCDDKKNEVKAQMQGARVTEVNRELSKLWRTCSPDVKQEYEEEAARRKLKYFQGLKQLSQQNQDEASCTMMDCSDIKGLKQLSQQNQDEASCTMMDCSDIKLQRLDSISSDTRSTVIDCGEGSSISYVQEMIPRTVTGSENSNSGHLGDNRSDEDNQDLWSCVACTFKNHPALSDCEQCETSRYAFELMKMQMEMTQIRKQTESSVALPSYWLTPEPGIRLKKVLLSPEDEIFKKIFLDLTLVAMLTTAYPAPHPVPATSIIKIERIENPHLYQMYSVKRSLMIAENSSDKGIERMLWHGTAANSVENICLFGFNRSYCGKNATAFGKGVYFACAPPYSLRLTYSPADKHGVRYMFYCRVLTGKYCNGTQTMVEPPLLNKSQTARFDSVVDCCNNPNLFVIFHDAQVYPEYLITFK